MCYGYTFIIWWTSFKSYFECLLCYMNFAQSLVFSFGLMRFELLTQTKKNIVIESCFADAVISERKWLYLEKYSWLFKDPPTFLGFILQTLNTNNFTLITARGWQMRRPGGKWLCRDWGMGLVSEGEQSELTCHMKVYEIVSYRSEK